MTTSHSPDSALLAELGRAQELGFIGPGPLDPHVAHAERFLAVVDAAPARALDLGSGGGLPGLVLAARWPMTTWVLLDGSTTRAAFLEAAVEELGWSAHVSVVGERAEVAARGDLRSTFDLVVVRAFGPPAVVAECAAGFLVEGGVLVVSEPPDSPADRWDHPDELAALGLRCLPQQADPGLQVLRLETPTPDRYPRRVGIPSKRPLF